MEKRLITKTVSIKGELFYTPAHLMLDRKEGCGIPYLGLNYAMLERTSLRCTNDVFINHTKLFTAFRGGRWSVQSHPSVGCKISSVLKNLQILALLLGHFVLQFFHFEASSNKVAVIISGICMSCQRATTYVNFVLYLLVY